jgi:hypothetical protein
VNLPESSIAFTTPPDVEDLLDDGHWRVVMHRMPLRETFAPALPEAEKFHRVFLNAGFSPEAVDIETLTSEWGV